MISSIRFKRVQKDIKKLKHSHYEVEINPQDPNEIWVILKGPKDTLYQRGIWRVRVFFTKQYPYKSPSIGFTNKIFHPNIDLNSGSICLDVLNQKWTPIFELKNVFDNFLPQLLRYPNADDPLNVDAADLMKNDLEEYKRQVLTYTRKYSLQKIEARSGRGVERKQRKVSTDDEMECASVISGES